MRIFKNLGFIAVAVVAFAFAASAQAATPAYGGNYSYSCSNSVYGVSGTFYEPTASGNRNVFARVGYPIDLTRCNLGGTANEASTVATSQAVVRIASAQTANLISNRIGNVTSGQGTGFASTGNGFAVGSGLAGGNGTEGIGVWASGTFTSLEDDVVSTAFDGEIWTVMVGVDYKVDSNWLVGVGLGYEDIDLSTSFNEDVATGEDGKLEGTGYTIAPYMSYAFTDMLSFQLTGGYSAVEYDTVSFSSSSRGTGTTDADRYFVKGALAAYYPVDEWRLSGNIGILYADEDKDAFTETFEDGTTRAQASQDSDITQLTLNTYWGYEIEEGIQPYAIAGLEYDLSKTDITVSAGQVQPNNDEDFGGVFGGGFKFYADGVTAGIEATTVEFRDDFEEYRIQGNVRVEF